MSSPSFLNQSSRGHKKREKTRNQLIAAGLRVVAERGEALTVSDVVAEADVSNGTFYNYFADRDGFFDALAAQLVESLAAEAAIEVQSEDVALRFATVSARVLARAAGDPTWGKVVLRFERIHPGVQESSTRYMREDLDQGFAEGRFEVGASEAAVDLVGGMLMMAVHRIVEGRATRAYVIDAIARVLRALGLAPQEIRAIAERAVSEAGLVLD